MLQRSTWSGLDIVLISIALLLLFTLILGLGALLPQSGFTLDSLTNAEAETPTLSLTIWLLAASGLSLLIGVTGTARLRQRQHLLRESFRTPSLVWTVAAFALGTLAIPLSSIIVLAVQLILEREPENVQLDMILPEGFSATAMVSMLLLGGLLVPVGEELLFRAVLYRWLRDRWGVTAAVLISSSVFGLFHGEIALAIGAGALGAMMAWAFERSGSLWVPIAIHAINNSFKIGLLYLFAYLGVPLQ